jgi:hypothetical protein
MAVDERARHELHERLDEVLRREEATTLMSLLPPVGWADVATKHDLSSLGRELRAEMAQLSSELRGELAEVRSEIGQLRSELRGEIVEVRGELRAEFHRDLAVLTRTLVISMLTTVIAVAGLAFGAASLI